MISRKNRRIIRHCLEGTGSPQEKQQLDTLMAENPELKAFVDAMDQVDAKLTETAKDQPEIDLREPIMQSIRQKENAFSTEEHMKKQHISITPWKKMVKQLFPNPQLNIAYAFIAGLIIGIAVISLFYQWDHYGYVSEWEMTGAMKNNDAEAIFILPVDLPDIKMDLKAFTLPQDFVQITVEVTSDKSSIIHVTYNNSSFQVWSLRALEQKQGCQIMSGYNSVEIGNLGQNTYSLLLKKLTDVDEELIIDIYVEGNLEYNTRMTL